MGGLFADNFFEDLYEYYFLNNSVWKKLNSINRAEVNEYTDSKNKLKQEMENTSFDSLTVESDP